MANQGLSYEGCNFLRQRLVLSTLSGKRVRIKNIRSKEDDPGLRDFEASFIRLLDKVTNGSRIEINQTGTVLSYQPGLLYGGSIEHDCNPQRSIGYYLEALLMLAPFMKMALKATLRGVTNDPNDPTIDLLKTTAVPLMKRFGIDGEGFDLRVVKRGMAPGGGGEVVLSCPIRRTLKPVQLTEQAKIKRIRGVAYSVRVSPQMANRIVESTRAVLNQFIPDIYIYTDHMKGANSGKSPGFGLTLVAETQNGCFLGAEMSSTPQGQGDPILPEDLGRNCAKLLLEEIYRVTRATTTDTHNDSLSSVCHHMVLPLSPRSSEPWRLCGFVQSEPGAAPHDPWPTGCIKGSARTPVSIHD
uniref:RNA 3'-terminal phosphate cyclase-like protein n=1 Tax=Oryzias latipes TaxID=8090 RepID=A0A3P9M757_ORYLA